MVRIFLLRHGQTDWNREYRYQGRTDIPLNRTGIDQAHEAAKGLAGRGSDLVASSPLARAAETAEIIAGRLGLPLHLHDDLAEISHGRWDGRTREEVGERYLEIIASWNHDPYGQAAPGGESAGRVRDRALSAIEGIIAEKNPQTLLVVAHDGTLRAVRLGLLGEDFERYLDVGLEPGQAIEYSRDDGIYRQTGSLKLW
jgi:broad specificity phosphatase PhoE